MFKRIRLRIQDMKTIGKLISGADEQAHISGEEEPGAEHYLLSALKMSDGSARRVFERVGADSDKFHEAIGKQYSDALKFVGIDAESIDNDFEPVETERMLHNSKPSGQAVMKKLYALKKQDKDRPLLGAHVVGVVANMSMVWRQGH
jgi:ATP-dependent Clp protease ATP-binding subunit ClpA